MVAAQRREWPWAGEWHVSEQAEMAGGGPANPVGKLPVLSTVIEAYRFVFGQPVSLATALAVPFALWYLLQWEVTLLILEGVDAMLSPIDAGSRAVAGKLQVYTNISAQLTFWLFAETLFAVAWHRFVLLGSSAARPRLFTFWRGRHWRFFGYLWIMLLVFHLPTSPPLLLTLVAGLDVSLGQAALTWISAGVLLLDVVLTYLLVRVSLVFPASTIDRNCSVRESWSGTHGQGLRLLIATSFGMMPLLLLVILEFFRGTSEVVIRGDQITFVEQPILGSYKADATVTMFVVFLATALTVTLLSLAYRHCTGLQSPSVADDQEPAGEA
jgi:hypothetical protein